MWRLWRLCIKSASFIDNCNSLSIGMAGWVDSLCISTLKIKRSTDHTRKQPVKNPEQKGWIGWIYVGWMIWHIAIIAWEEEKLILSRTANRFFFGSFFLKDLFPTLLSSPSFKQLSIMVRMKLRCVRGLMFRSLGYDAVSVWKQMTKKALSSKVYIAHFRI